MVLCFDAQKYNAPSKMPYFNWYARDGPFSKGLIKADPYTDLFWHMFFIISPFLGSEGRDIVHAMSYEDEILPLWQSTLQVWDLMDCQPTKEEIPVLIKNVKTLVDEILLMSVYCHKSNYEDCILPAR